MSGFTFSLLTLVESIIAWPKIRDKGSNSSTTSTQRQRMLTVTCRSKNKAKLPQESTGMFLIQEQVELPLFAFYNTNWAEVEAGDKMDYCEKPRCVV